MSNLRNIPHITIILISFTYSVFVVANYLEIHFSMVVSIVASVVLALLSHYYLIYSIREIIKTKNVHQSIIIAVVLLGVVVFMEFEGVEKVTYQNTVDRTQLDQDKALQKDLLHQLAKIGTSRRWQDVESKRLIAEQLEEVKTRIQYGLKRFEEMEEKAEMKAQQFRLFSLIFIGLSLLASSCIQSEEQESIKPVLKPVSKAFKNENEEEENPKPKQVYKSVDELGTKQRIALAVEHINQSKQCKFSFLMKEFRLSPKQVKEAKQLSNYEGKEGERKVIGF